MDVILKLFLVLISCCLAFYLKDKLSDSETAILPQLCLSLLGAYFLDELDLQVKLYILFGFVCMLYSKIYGDNSYDKYTNALAHFSIFTLNSSGLYFIFYFALKSVYRF